MNLNEYQAQAARTMNWTMSPERKMTNCALGLAGEAGEVADIIKKHLFHGHKLDAEALEQELGDVLWYVAILARALGVPLADIAQINLDKLRARYPDGFDPERSQNRSE